MDFQSPATPRFQDITLNSIFDEDLHGFLTKLLGNDLASQIRVCSNVLEVIHFVVALGVGYQAKVCLC
jgi:hypothetical protein